MVDPLIELILDWIKEENIYGMNFLPLLMQRTSLILEKRQTGSENKNVIIIIKKKVLRVTWLGFFLFVFFFPVCFFLYFQLPLCQIIFLRTALISDYTLNLLSTEMLLLTSGNRNAFLLLPPDESLK